MKAKNYICAECGEKRSGAPNRKICPGCVMGRCARQSREAKRVQPEMEPARIAAPKAREKPRPFIVVGGKKMYAVGHGGAR